MVIVGTCQVFYEKATAEAMAHRVAEAFRRGSARGSEVVVTCDLFTITSTIYLGKVSFTSLNSGYHNLPRYITIDDPDVSKNQVALVADVGRPNRLAAKHDAKPASLCQFGISSEIEHEQMNK